MATSSLEEVVAGLAKSQVELAKSQAEFANSQSQFMNETRETLKIQSVQLKNLEVQVGKMENILSEEQQMSLPTLEELGRVEVDSMELHALVVK